jgi:hypothetical protein
MILKYSDDKYNTKTKVFLQCDKCGTIQCRPYKKYIELVEHNDAFDMDYCEPCWVSIRQQTPEARRKMSNSIQTMMKKDPAWKIRNSKSKKGIINVGEKNGMKRSEVSQKVSNFRKELFKDPEERKKVSMATAKAWANGKFEGVRVGQSKWHEYQHSNGNTYKVQGTWELEFIKWLDVNNLTFKCHEGRIPYEKDGMARLYYPDFWVDAWGCWVDIKNEYHYSINKEKFDILNKNGHNIKLIFKEELEKLIGTRL